MYVVLLVYMSLVHLDNVVAAVGYEGACPVLDLGMCERVGMVELTVHVTKAEIYNYLIVTVFHLGVVIGLGGETCDEGVIGCGVKFKVGSAGPLALYSCTLGSLWFREVVCVSLLWTVSVPETTCDGLTGVVVPNNEPGCLVSVGHPCSPEADGGELCSVCGHDKLTTSVGGSVNSCADYAVKGMS